MTTLRKQVYHINSENRVSGTASNFVYKLDNFPSWATHVCLVSASIPKTWYLINDNNNTFTLTEDGTDISVEITNGDYTKSSFANYLTAKLSSITQSSATYTVSKDSTSASPETGKYTFTTDQTSYTTSFTFGTEVYQQLGFEKNTTYTFTDGTLRSVNTINMNKENTVFLRTSLVNDFNDNILTGIYSDFNSTYSSIAYQVADVEYESRPIGNSKSNTYSFYLTDENGVPLDTNGINIVFTIVVFGKVDFQSKNLYRASELLKIAS
jgi:hypothetical protein